MNTLTATQFPQGPAALLAGVRDMPSSDSCHTLASYMNKPERERNGERRSRGSGGCKSNMVKSKILEIFASRVKQ